MTNAELDEAIAKAGDEWRLDPAYRSTVRPLLRMPRDRWPTCCGSTCEPCATTLVCIADRALELLGLREPLEG